MEEKIEQKQQYLRSEIIDQGYNPDDFSEFMGSIRGEENLDLQAWTLSELQNVVYQYKSKISDSIKQEQEQKDQNVEQQMAENDELNKQNLEQIKSNEFKFPNDPFENYEQVIKAVKLAQSELNNNNNLFVSISSPVKVNPGFFSSSYYQYTVQTKPLNFKVVRKVSDFTFLNQVLPLFNPSIYNPVLPTFEFGLKDDSPKKMLLIQNYINSLLEIEYFRALPIILEFLSLKQEDWNKKRIEKYNKMKPLPLEKIPSLEGEFHILINKDNDNKGIKIKEEINKKNEAYDILSIAIDEILSAIDKISLYFKNLGKAFYDLSKIHKNKNDKLYGVFTRLSSLSKNWSRNYLKEKDFLNDEFKYFFNYMNNENISFLKKFEEFKLVRDDYKSKYDKMKKTQNKTEKDLNIFENLRKEYGLELLMVNREYQQLEERQGNRVMNQFLKFSNSKETILQNYNNCMKLFDINEDPNNLETKNSYESSDSGNILESKISSHSKNNE